MAWVLAALPLIVRGGTVRRLDRLRRRCSLGLNPAASLVPADVGRAQRIGRAGGGKRLASQVCFAGSITA